jgi:hypothetical protein
MDDIPMLYIMIYSLEETSLVIMQFTPVNDDRVQIYLLFYRPAADDAFQNKLVAYFDGPFCHVEMAFPERYGTEPWEKEVLGSSIYQGDVIFFKSKTYQREGYFSFAIEVSKAQSLKIKNYCRIQSERGVPFSKLAMYSAYLPVQLFNIEGSFCSKHVTMALQEGEVEEVMHLNPCLVTPSSLYKILLLNNAKRPIVHVVPSKMVPPTNGDYYGDATQDCAISLRQHNQYLCSKMAEDLIITLKNERMRKDSPNNTKKQDDYCYAPPSERLSVAEVQQNISKTFIKDFLSNTNKNLSLII